MPMKPMRRFTYILVAISLILLDACQNQDRSSTPDLETRIAQVKSKAIASRGPGTPALWKASDGDTVVYLFGTVHSLPENTEWSSKKIEAAFQAADTLVLETDFTSKKAKTAIGRFEEKNGMLPAGQSLFSHMDVGDAYRLRTMIERLGQNPKEYDYMQPWLATLKLGQMRLEKSGYSGAQGVDAILRNRAENNDLSVSYLENVEDQLMLFSDGNMDRQIESLIAISFGFDDTATNMRLVTEEWLDGDIEGLGLLVANPDIARSEQSYEAILTNRNLNWSKQIHSLFDSPGTIFIAVGAAHLAGPDSLIELINVSGVSMERVQ